MEEKIKKIFSSLDITHIGFCPFAVVKDFLIPCAGLKRIPQNAKTVICALFPYKVRDEHPENISRYGAVPDYHNICGEMLLKAREELQTAYPNNQFETFIDNSPIPEVYCASAAGLGAMGKNGLLINKDYGSFVFIGEIVTDLDLALNPTEPVRCMDCGKCKSACPVCLDKERCLSKITQKKGELTPQEEQLIRENGSVWGCDICAEVCPINKNAKITYVDDFINGYRHRYTEGEDMTGRPYAWRGEKVIRRNSDLFKGKK